MLSGDESDYPSLKKFELDYDDDCLSRHQDTTALFTKLTFAWAARKSRLWKTIRFRGTQERYEHSIEAFSAKGDSEQKIQNNLVASLLVHDSTNASQRRDSVSYSVENASTDATRARHSPLDTAFRRGCKLQEFCSPAEKRPAAIKLTVDEELYKVSLQVNATPMNSDSDSGDMEAIMLNKTGGVQGDLHVEVPGKSKPAASSAEEIIARQHRNRFAREASMAITAAERWISVEHAVRRTIAAGRIVRAMIKYQKGRLHAKLKPTPVELVNRMLPEANLAQSTGSAAGIHSAQEGWTATVIEPVTDLYKAETPDEEIGLEVSQSAVRRSGALVVDDTLTFTTVLRQRAQMVSDKVCRFEIGEEPSHRLQLLCTAAAISGVFEADIASAVTMARARDKATRARLSANTFWMKGDLRHKFVMDRSHFLALGFIEDVAAAESSMSELECIANTTLSRALLSGSIDNVFDTKRFSGNLSLSEERAVADADIQWCSEFAFGKFNTATAIGKAQEFVSAVTRIVRMCNMGMKDSTVMNFTGFIPEPKNSNFKLLTLGQIAKYDFERLMLTADTALQAFIKSCPREVTDVATADAAFVATTAALFGAKAFWGHRIQEARTHIGTAIIFHLLQFESGKERARKARAELDNAAEIVAALGPKHEVAAHTNRKMLSWARWLLTVTAKESILLQLNQQAAQVYHASSTIQVAWRAVRHRDRRVCGQRAASARLIHMVWRTPQRRLFPQLGLRLFPSNAGNMLVCDGTASDVDTYRRHPGSITTHSVIASAVFIQSAWRVRLARQRLAHAKHMVQCSFEDMTNESFMGVNKSYYSPPFDLDLDMDDNMFGRTAS
ncbi:uncharacterized protein MICPUCDRAFT_55282 [Micromonas pusilla CCMP1545]|uniref:Predicted protein n=1 Tax=Micromonas pusilla (strain CCMP1545) TaxID=564608 RepID=C1MKC4_MICPC|nr:uncharacterized protein MICPUCDRAFT_55282 [Micromonas pusilla CCMP1545]EEH59346.1 predicted protein [Micromonas pusilla CCMP1545]|eukprot:XP_003055970.1 predicted protein [Micromonas pusilla CCMP1545]